MSRENVEVAAAWYEAYNRKDMEGALALMHVDVDCTSAGMSGVEGSSHMGHEGMRRYFTDLWETWEDPQVVVEQLFERGDHVVMLGYTTGAGKLSGISVDFPVASVIYVEDGLIRRYRTYREWDEALAIVDELESARGG